MLKFSLLACLSLCCITPAIASGKHNHGVGGMDVVIEGEMLTVSLELPLDSVVGFERAPRNAKEKAALEAATKLLSAGVVLPVQNGIPSSQPTSGIGCAAIGTEVKAPFAEGAAVSEHADFDVEYRFRCTTPGALIGIDTTLFKSFPRLYRLDVQRIGPKGQGGGRLTPKNPTLRW